MLICSHYSLFIYLFVYYCRMRDRGKQKVPPPKKTRPGMSRKSQKIQQMEKPRQLQKQVKALSLRVAF